MALLHGLCWKHIAESGPRGKGRELGHLGRDLSQSVRRPCRTRSSTRACQEQLEQGQCSSPQPPVVLPGQAEGCSCRPETIRQQEGSTETAACSLPAQTPPPRRAVAASEHPALTPSPGAQGVTGSGALSLPAGSCLGDPACKQLMTTAGRVLGSEWQKQRVCSQWLLRCPCTLPGGHRTKCLPFRAGAPVSREDEGTKDLGLLWPEVGASVC